MNIDMSKPLDTLAMNITDFIDIDYGTIKSVASSSSPRGQFLKDRGTLPCREFLSMYFPGYEVNFTKRETKPKISRRSKTKPRDLAMHPKHGKYGKYIIALYQNGNEYTVTYRSVKGLKIAWYIPSEHEIVYKADGRRFSVVHHVQTNKEAQRQKKLLIQELAANGLVYKRDMPH